MINVKRNLETSTYIRLDCDCIHNHLEDLIEDLYLIPQEETFLEKFRKFTHSLIQNVRHGRNC